jgi:hypothetical protein
MPKHPQTPAETCPAITNIKNMATSRFSIRHSKIWNLLRRLSIECFRRQLTQDNSYAIPELIE